MGKDTVGYRRSWEVSFILFNVMGISDFMESGENYDNMLIKRSYTIKVVLLYHLNEAL